MAAARFFIGLGNPGSAYAKQRHNIGKRIVMAMAARYAAASFRDKKLYRLAVGDLPAPSGSSAYFIAPRCYMNDSGKAVAAVLRDKCAPLSSVMVIHDEVDLPAAQVKMKFAGGNAGHNGLRSIDSLLGNGYARLRIGIGHPGHKSLVHGHVLGNFLPQETQSFEKLIALIVENTALCSLESRDSFLKALQ